MTPVKTLIASLLVLFLLAVPALAAPVATSPLEVKLSYPQAHDLGEAGQKINSSLAAEINAFVLRVTESLHTSPLPNFPPLKKMQIIVDHTFTLNQAPLLGVTLTEMMYTGGAHPMTYLRAFTFDTRTGEALSFGDLFRKDADYRTRLNEIMAAQITERKIPIFSFRPFGGVKDDQEFYLTPEGLVVYYQLYEYTPYVAGFLKFPVPYATVADLLKPEVAAMIAPGSSQP